MLYTERVNAVNSMDISEDFSMDHVPIKVHLSLNSSDLWLSYLS